MSHRSRLSILLLDLPPEQQRRYFFNAVGSFISRGASRFPLLMVIDDIHWAESTFLDLVKHLVEAHGGQIAVDNVMNPVTTHA